MAHVAHELRLYGHRGASALLPENTIAAFRRALDDGANALELDVHRTADGQLVVAHDPDGRRMAGVPRRICDCRLAEVQSWNLARGCSSDSREVRSVPTLDQVLAEFPGVPISIDVKPCDPRAVVELMELVARQRAWHRITVGSFHDRLVRLVRRLRYMGATALTRTEVAVVRLLPVALARRLVHGQAAMIPRRSGGIRLDTTRFIARCGVLGLRVDYWVVNDPASARQLLAAGATGIVSDDPAIIAPVVAEFGELS